MAKDMPLPAARGRAVSQDAARMRGVPSSTAAAAPAAPAAAAGNQVADFVAHDPALEQLRSRIHAELKSELGLSARIKLVEPRSIARSEGKAKRIIDKRSLG